MILLTTFNKWVNNILIHFYFNTNNFVSSMENGRVLGKLGGGEFAKLGLDTKNGI